LQIGQAILSLKKNRLWADKIHFAGKQDVAIDYLNLLAQSLNEVAKSKGKP
jgi:hypothetical protein